MSNSYSARRLLGDLSPERVRPSRATSTPPVEDADRQDAKPPAKELGPVPESGAVVVAHPSASEEIARREAQHESDEATHATDFEAEQSQPDGVVAPIYGEFFGLRESPFNLTADPRFMFLTPGIKEALSNIRYGLSQARGLTVLLGDAGTGKTTLVRAAMADLASDKSRCILIANPVLSREEFYELLASQFGFHRGAARSKTQFLAALERALRASAEAGGITGLIVDEAQSLPYALLEEIRLLGNIETTQRKLLNIVLSGQPELADRLNEPGLRQLKQRVALRCSLAPLTEAEAMSYVSGRVRVAGGAPREIFTLEAVAAVYRASAGIPRTINVICDNALLSGFALQVKPVTAAIVADVCRDFDYVAPETSPRSAMAAPSASAQDHQPPAGPAKKRFGFSFFS